MSSRVLAEKIADWMADSEGPLSRCLAPSGMGCAGHVEANIDPITDQIEKIIDREIQPGLLSTLKVEPDPLEALRDKIEGIRADAAGAMSSTAPIGLTIQRIQRQAESALALAEEIMREES
jgi:hypothetical protein